MPKFKYFESIYNQLSGRLLCVISLVVLPLIFLLPSNDILTLLAKTDVLQQLHMPVKGPLLTIEFLVCCLALFLCWSIVEVHRQRSNMFFENLLRLANEVDLTNTQHLQDDLLLKKSINLVEQTLEGYAMLLLMTCKHPTNLALPNSVDTKEISETEKGMIGSHIHFVYPK